MARTVLAVLLVFIFCGTAAADLFVNIGTSGGSWPYTPYIITPIPGPDVPSWMPAQFNTFCVERYQTFSPGDYRATIDDDILYAGGSTPVVLDDDVKKIYAAYLNGALGGITGNVVQTSVWGARGYSGYSVDTSIASIIGDAGSVSGWNNVKALNLWGASGQDRQSQLVMTPVPGAGILGAIGLGLAGWRLRKSRAIAAN